MKEFSFVVVLSVVARRLLCPNTHILDLADLIGHLTGCYSASCLSLSEDWAYQRALKNLIEQHPRLGDSDMKRALAELEQLLAGDSRNRNLSLWWLIEQRKRLGMRFDETFKVKQPLAV